MDHTKPLPSRKPLLGLMCLRRCSSRLCRLDNEGALIFRMAPLLCVFSSSPSVSTRPKNLTGCAWVQIAVDIIVEIFKTFLPRYPSFPPALPPFLSAHIFLSCTLRCTSHRKLVLSICTYHLGFFTTPAPGHRCGLCLGLPVTTEFVLMHRTAEGVCLPCLPLTQL